MPKYRKKITRRMEYDEFKTSIIDLPIARQAFLTILFFSGCRISEALALTPDNISCTPDTIYIEFHRLKGSKQTDPTPLPRNTALYWLCQGDWKSLPKDERIFTFSRTTAYRIVRRAFPSLYPHFFRQNRITKISEDFGDAHVYSFVGICAQSIDHYRGKVDIKRVGKALHEEIN
jgi:integrase